jgi:hypothetical protein
MCFESAVGCTLLAVALIGYIVSKAIGNINWALHLFYLKKLLSTY